MEARVGIEPGSELSQIPPKPFGSGSFSNCCTGKDINRIESLNQANNAQHSPAIPNYFQYLWCPFWCLYMANWHSSGDWQFKQPVTVALPTVILKAGWLRC